MKPVLLWPVTAAAIPASFEQPPEYFAVIDTSEAGALEQLSVLRPDSLVLDPFPDHGGAYREAANHVRAHRCRYHVIGLAACQDVVRALKDPSLARAGIDELLLALGYPDKQA